MIKMKKQEILEFAIKGIATEIDELEKSIYQCRRFLFAQILY